jgi:predicted 2-oxoglutarate/Fe(II)-dependent dioxygenase YbiX
MDAGQVEPAEILHDRIELQDEVRRAMYVEVAGVVLADVEARLDAARDAIGRFFGLALTAREGAGFVRYPDGGFYRAHRDRADVVSWPDASRRRIAVVVFLNDDFSGGILRLLEHEALDLVPAAGALVAFPADRLHEVTPVRGRMRDAVVDWYV